MDRTVIVTNMLNAQVGVKDNTTGMIRRWNKRGHKIPIPFDVIEQLMWQDGFRRMIESGILYIENLQDKINLGIEPYGTDKPVNIIVLSDKRMEELMTTIPLEVFKEEMQQLPRVQVDNLIEYAINNKKVDSAKCAFLKSLTGKDIFKAIAAREDDEAVLLKEQNRAR